MADPEATIDPTLPAPVAAPAAAPVPAAGRGSGAGAIALLLALVALLAGSYALWRSVAFERDHAGRLVQIAQNTRTQSDTLATLTDQITTLVDRGAGLERRVADAETVNRSLREELLGLGERARLVEDAVANLAESRLEGAAALRLNEAELLLRLGAARLALFRDTAGAIAAYRLADAQLAQLDDATLAGVRQTVAAEIAALIAHRGAPVEATLADLDSVADALPSLPTRIVTLTSEPGSVVPSGYGARLAHVLGSLVRVRRIDERDDSALAPLAADAARAAVELELGLAKAAVVAHDDARLARTVGRARRAIERSFDTDAQPVRTALARLAQVAASANAEPLPPIGRALEELGNLRATRAAAAPAGAPADAGAATIVGVTPAPAPTPPPADEPPDVPAPEPQSP